MAKQPTAAIEAKPSVIVRVQEFWRDVKNEMTKVTWPGQDELKSHTQIILFMLAVTAAIIYFYDVIFQVVVFFLLRLL